MVAEITENQFELLNEGLFVRTFGISGGVDFQAIKTFGQSIYYTEYGDLQTSFAISGYEPYVSAKQNVDPGTTSTFTEFHDYYIKNRLSSKFKDAGKTLIFVVDSIFITGHLVSIEINQSADDPKVGTNYTLRLVGRLHTNHVEGRREEPERTAHFSTAVQLQEDIAATERNTNLTEEDKQTELAKINKELTDLQLRRVAEDEGLERSIER